MKKEDLTVVKHIGPARMKVLNDSGITTIKTLYEIPLEKLARVETIGEHYAKRIKDAVAQVYAPPAEETAVKAGAAHEKKVTPTDQNLQKKLKILNTQLRRVNEKLKPLGKKKYLEIYLDFKKRSKKLKQHLRKLNSRQTNFSEKVSAKIIKKSDALIVAMKNVGKKPKRKTYKSLSREIQSLTKKLRNAGS